jgi:hypothetical protein
MPTKKLPSRASLEQLKHQAKDLLKEKNTGDLAALQRIREFHPRFTASNDAGILAAKFALSDAQLAIAREYGYPSWPKMKARVENPALADDERPHHERIKDPVFRHAVDLIDAGDPDKLRSHLKQHPGLVHQRVIFDGGNYFRNPALLEFIAENPIRRGKLPPNIVEVAKVLLDGGARADKEAVDSALGLVSSGRVPREAGLQIPLIDLLCQCGADADGAMQAALAHGEFAAAEALLRHGASVSLSAAAAMGRLEEAKRSISSANAEERHRAFALAAQFGHVEIVRLLLDAGEDPNRYNPVGAHSHSTPLHQAAWHGHRAVVQLLLDRGARKDIRDILFQGTPADWARHAGRADLAAYLGVAEEGSPARET